MNTLWVYYSILHGQLHTLSRLDYLIYSCDGDIIPSEARLYSGSIDLHRCGHHRHPYPATSPDTAYQTHSKHLPTFAIGLCIRDLEAILTITGSLGPHN